MSLFIKGDRVRIVNSPVFPMLLGRCGTVIRTSPLTNLSNVYVYIRVDGFSGYSIRFAERDVELLSCELNAETRLNRTPHRSHFFASISLPPCLYDADLLPCNLKGIQQASVSSQNYP